MKSSYFAVDRKLTPEEWGELKSWRTTNPDLRWKQGDVREDGLRFWQYAQNRRDGEMWVSAEQFDQKRAEIRSINTAWRSRNPDKARETSTRSAKKWRASNHELAKERARAYIKKARTENPERDREAARRWRERNPDKVRASRKRTRENNRKSSRRYERERMKNNPLAAIAKRARVRTAGAIRDAGYRKMSRTADILGCCWETLMFHLESKFVDGMSWDNRSRWHIDHIMPLASAKTEEELVALCHYTNLQPLWAAENLRKSDKLPA
jgi:hypothetical protein